MSEIKFSNFINEDGSGGPDLVGVTTFTSPYYFVPPSGTTAQRPSGEGLAPGTLRFNTDIGRLEVWRGDHWATILGESPSLNGGARGVFGGGDTPSGVNNTIDYITISTLGNALDFGDLVYSRSYAAGCSSSTRGIIAGGYTGGSDSNVIQYITISSTGNAIDFGGILTTIHRQGPGCSNSTRGLFMGRYSTPGESNVIDYITIASTGNAQDFGDLTRTVSSHASCSSSTRGIAAGGFANNNVIDYVTISTTGNALDFGDLYIAVGRLLNSGLSNSTRGLFAGSYTGPTAQNVIQFITIATTGNSQDFGDLINSTNHVSGVSSPTRGVWGGGNASPTNIVQYVTMQTTGNAQDFGDLTVGRGGSANISNGHGGL